MQEPTGNFCTSSGYLQFTSHISFAMFCSRCVGSLRQKKEVERAAMRLYMPCIQRHGRVMMHCRRWFFLLDPSLTMAFAVEPWFSVLCCMNEWCVVVLPGKSLVLVRSDTLQIPCIIRSLALSALFWGNSRHHKAVSDPSLKKLFHLEEHHS